MSDNLYLTTYILLLYHSGWANALSEKEAGAASDWRPLALRDRCDWLHGSARAQPTSALQPVRPADRCTCSAEFKSLQRRAKNWTFVPPLFQGIKLCPLCLPSGTISAAGTTTMKRMWRLWTLGLIATISLMMSSGWTSSTRMGNVTSPGTLLFFLNQNSFSSI